MAVFVSRNESSDRLLVPLLAFSVFIALATGAARIYQQAHWPSDVAAGYLFGVLWLILLIPVFLWLRRGTWSSGRITNSFRKKLSMKLRGPSIGSPKCIKP